MDLGGVPFGILVVQKSGFWVYFFQKMGLEVREHGVTKRLVAQNVAGNYLGVSQSYGNFGRYEAIYVTFSDFFQKIQKFQISPRPVGSELRPQNW